MSQVKPRASLKHNLQDDFKVIGASREETIQ